MADQVLARVESFTSPGVVYEIRFDAAGRVYCTCPAWRYSKKRPRWCKHVRKLYSDAMAGARGFCRPGPAAAAGIQRADEDEAFARLGESFPGRDGTLPACIRIATHVGRMAWFHDRDAGCGADHSYENSRFYVMAGPISSWETWEGSHAAAGVKAPVTDLVAFDVFTDSVEVAEETWRRAEDWLREAA